MENESQIKPDAPVAFETYQRLVRARKFIDQCYHLPLDLRQISSEACLSRYHFLRLFRRAFNKTPHQYVTQRRIEKAKRVVVFERAYGN
jgi:AraC-like DNA-binding protein